MYLILAVSAENGCEGFLLYDKSPNGVEFCVMYDQIARHGKEFEIFVDQASWHTSKYTRKYFKDRGSNVIVNLPYEPFLNPTEFAGACVKNSFKRIKLERIMKG